MILIHGIIHALKAFIWMEESQKKYPCLVIWVEVTEQNSFRHTVYFECVYPEDLLIMK